jgi:anti-sigma factor RsiW
MKHSESHLSDQLLLLEMEGELSAGDEKRVRAHLAACWTCRARRQEFEGAIAAFVQIPRPELPPAAGPRALLKARLAELSNAAPESSPQSYLLRGLTAVAALCMALALGVFVLAGGSHQQTSVYYRPDAQLTPGATVLSSRSVVCSRPGDGNKVVPAALQREVFQEYGIPRADPRAYEVDYLVTPALGGADDIHNLWPHSHSALWNARVKDALEDRMRTMVCDGSLDLSEAQQEIATNWISAYKKYFHTEEPLPEHRRSAEPRP